MLGLFYQSGYMKKVLLLLLLCCSAVVYGQTTSSFTFSRYIGAYTSIVGGSGTIATTVLSKDDTTMLSVPIGFSFSYCTTPYTTLSANSNGWLSLANTSYGTTASTTINSSLNHDASVFAAMGGGIGLLMPFWDDLKGTGSTAYYQTSGTSPYRVFTFQWGSPTSLWGTITGSGTATFQVKLYETTGVIEYVYGPSSYSLKTATIGLSNSTGDYRTLTTEASTTTGAGWTYLIDTTPVLNTVMEWAPPCPTPPPASTGTFTVCQGATTTLSNTAVGGTWISSSVSVATVGSGTGVVTGIAGGVANISYKLSPGCFAISVVTVNALPDTIVGGANACEGGTKIYSDVTTGGTWSSSNTAVGTISSGGGFGGVTSGTTTIGYTLATGCTRTLDVTVNSQPVITGSNIACIGDTTVLTSVVTGGTWSSSNIARATVDAYGNVVGVTLGSVIVTYTAASGCKDTISMTVQTDCGTAVHDINGTAGKINIFPHPTNGDFYLSIPMTGSVEVSISDLYGRVLISKKVDVVRSNKIHFNESANLPAGSYILRVANNDQMLTERMTIIK